MRTITAVLACGFGLALAQGCGSSTNTTPSSASGGASTGTTSSGEAATALSAEARSAATGDIPDNQIFLTYRSASPRYSMVYPEGWALKGTGSNTTIAEKNNIVHIVVTQGSASTPAGMTGELDALKRANPSLTFTTPAVIRLKTGAAVKSTYTTRSAPNPVTGKSVLLVVDRYELGKAGLHATVDLGTPSGVDNVDAYRKMINSFNWQ